jgi:hypothetical protein
MTLAEMELASGNPGGAMRHARAVLSVDGDHVGALETLAKAQWQTSSCDELLITLGRLIELNPYEPGYQVLLAGAFQSLGLCGEAVKAYLRAIDLGVPKSEEMDAMIEELRAWQSSLVAQMMATDVVFRAAYDQDPVKACADRGFDFAISAEHSDVLIQERQSRAQVSIRRS